MKSILCSVAIMLSLALVVPCQAQPSPFKTYNPDIDKYDFTRQFIVGLGYYKKVFDRLKVEESGRENGVEDIDRLKMYVDDRTLDNTEVRIAKNYLTRFTTSKNAFVQKVARDAIAQYDAMLALNMKERDRWQELYRFRSTGKPEGFDEAGFNDRMQPLIQERKAAGKGLLTASALLKTVLLSAEYCDSEDCKYLALTGDERKKLATALDQYARDNYQWGIKEGQSTFEATVAAIREVLEDPIYISRDK